MRGNGPPLGPKANQHSPLLITKSMQHHSTPVDPPTARPLACPLPSLSRLAVQASGQRRSSPAPRGTPPSSSRRSKTRGRVAPRGRVVVETSPELRPSRKRARDRPALPSETTCALCALSLRAPPRLQPRKPTTPPGASDLHDHTLQTNQLVLRPPPHPAETQDRHEHARRSSKMHRSNGGNILLSRRTLQGKRTSTG